MQLVRVHISQFRKLRDAFEIGPLSTGLNVIAGDNEEGKSTVLDAIRAVLFDRHTLSGEAAGRFQPFGASLRPEVSLDFRLDGHEYRIHKAFCQSPLAELQTPTERVSGPEVDERLRTLLGFSGANRGRAGMQHQGVWGLLWVEQGHAFLAPEVAETGRQVLQSALEAEVGNVLAGREGERLLEQVRAEYRKYLTAKTGKPTGEYRDAQKAVDSAAERLQALDDALALHESRIDQLARFREELADYRDGGRLAGFEQAARQAQADFDELEVLRNRLSEASATLQVSISRRELAQNRLQQRQSLVDALADLENASLSLGRTADAALEETRHSEAALADTERDRSACEDRLQSGRRRLAAVERRRRVEDLRTQHAALVKRLEQARSAMTEQDRTVATLTAIAVTEADARELSARHRELLTAEARLGATATRLRLHLTHEAELDGAPVSGESEHELPGPARLDLGAAGAIEIIPGTAQHAALRNDVERIRTELANSLGKLRLESAEAAESELTRRRDLESAIKVQKGLLLGLAPDGVPALEAACQTLERDRSHATAEPDEEATSDTDEAALQAELVSLESESERLNGLAKLRQAALEDNRLKERETRTLLRARTAEHARAAESLAALRAETPDLALRQASQKAEAEEVAGREAEAMARSALEQADPAAVAKRQQMARDALTAARDRIGALERAALEIEVDLRAEGQRGLGEERAGAVEVLSERQRRLARIERDADSIALLSRVLEDSARAAREAFLEPVTRRLAPYLRLLLPDAEVMLDDNLQIHGLSRGGHREPFDSLSVGTREQIATLTRLAFAELLAEQGQPACVILDDALVYADEQRFEQMKLILALAAERTQILLLTCRERDYLSLGAPVFRLSECRTGT